MTGQTIYNKVLALIDQFTEDGVPIASQDNIDIEKKVILFIDSAQREMWKNNRKTSYVEFTRTPPENRLDSNFTLTDFEGETQYYPNEYGINNVQGYSIQVSKDASDNATITFQELVGTSWVDLVTIVPTGITELTTYKGVLAVSSTSNNVRMVVQGSEHFTHQNKALWKLKYKAASVPTYEPWVKTDLPDDFHLVDMYVEVYDQGVYARTNDFRIENYRDFYIPFEFTGNIRVNYKPISPTYTDLSETIAIDDILAEQMVYDIVAKLGFYENVDLVNWAEGRRLEAKADASVDDADSSEVMVNYYS